MAQPELDRLIINNLADLDAAAQHIEKVIGPAIDVALENILKTSMAKIGWKAAVDKKGIWMAPRDWRKDEDHTGDDFECWFVLGERPEKAAQANRFFPTSLLGIGHQNVGLRWVREVRSKKLWKSALGQQQNAITVLRTRGFEYEAADGWFFLPFRIEPSALAEAFANESPELALTPFSDALQRCVDATPDFDALINAIGGMDGPKIPATVDPFVGLTKTNSLPQPDNTEQIPAE